MDENVVAVKGISKRYRIRHRTNSNYSTMRDAIAGTATRLLSGKSLNNRTVAEDFWALQDISFEIGRGEVLGIIGRNGAGKSTLLKILSQITEPTRGSATIAGRVASLLEVGTGFHPELSGRENIFLNGAVLGMRRREIASKFDAIVAFAEVEKFLDTPVKHYSSGMYVRLAFAVAAHLDPDILIVDEVLAVGDAGFQRKCLGKMKDVSQDGRTILFVSHNMGAISTLCERGIVLSQGHLEFDGPIDQALAHYSQSTGPSIHHPQGNGPRVLDIAIDPGEAVRGNLRVRVDFESPWPLSPPRMGVVVSSSIGAPLFGFNTDMDPSYQAPPTAKGSIVLDITDVPLHTGLYKASIWLGERSENLVALPDAAIFHFVAPDAIPGGISLEVIGFTRVKGRFRVDDSLVGSKAIPSVQP